MFSLTHPPFRPVLQTISGVGISDLGTPAAMANFQNAIVSTVAYGLKLYAQGGSVAIQSVTGNSRRLGEASSAIAVHAVRQLLQTKSVNVVYQITYPATADSQANVVTYEQNQLGALLYSGAMTQALQAAGFPAATANTFTYFQATPSPTAAPTAQLSPGKIAAAAVLSVLGCCCFGALGYYFAFVRGGGGGGAARTDGGAPDLQFSNVAPGPSGRPGEPTSGALI